LPPANLMFPTWSLSPLMLFVAPLIGRSLAALALGQHSLQLSVSARCYEEAYNRTSQARRIIYLRRIGFYLCFSCRAKYT